MRLTIEGLKEGRVSNRLSVVKNGIDALAFLRREGAYQEAPRPDIVLLDWHLPYLEGSEVLAEIKADRSLKRIPVVVLTSSAAEEDIARAYGLHANCYVTKPVDVDRFIDVVRSMDQFWLSVVKLPRGDADAE